MARALFFVLVLGLAGCADDARLVFRIVERPDGPVAEISGSPGTYCRLVRGRAWRGGDRLLSAFAGLVVEIPAGARDQQGPVILLEGPLPPTGRVSFPLDLARLDRTHPHGLQVFADNVDGRDGVVVSDVWIVRARGSAWEALRHDAWLVANTACASLWWGVAVVAFALWVARSRRAPVPGRWFFLVGGLLIVAAVSQRIMVDADPLRLDVGLCVPPLLAPPDAPSVALELDAWTGALARHRRSAEAVTVALRELGDDARTVALAWLTTRIPEACLRRETTEDRTTPGLWLTLEARPKGEVLERLPGGLVLWRRAESDR